MAFRTVLKDPVAILEYGFNWRNWLQDGETISSYSVTVPDGITLVTSSNDGQIVKAKLSGGTLGTTYSVSYQISTATRTDRRTLAVKVLQR